MANLISKSGKRSTKAVNALDKSSTKGVTFTQRMTDKVHMAMLHYGKDMGLSPQDVVRIAVANFLSREGYLVNN